MPRVAHAELKRHKNYYKPSVEAKVENEIYARFGRTHIMEIQLDANLNCRLSHKTERFDAMRCDGFF